MSDWHCGVLVIRTALLVVVMGVVAVVAGACGSSVAEEQQASSTTAFKGTNCDGTVAVMLPYGRFGATDSVQMNWARVSLDKFNQDHNTLFTFEPSNVDFDAEAGVTEAQRIVTNPNVIGVVGPKTSVVTKAVGPIFDAAGLVYVSPSATNATLTDGNLKGFYRVVASDALQGPRMAQFIEKELKPKTVLVVENDEPYSKGLADSIVETLTAQGIPSQRITVALEQKSYEDVVAQVTDSVNVVAMPLLIATDAQRLANQLRAGGKYPALIGGDSLFVGAFSAPGAYVATYAPDASTFPEGREIINLYQSIFGTFEAYGGPAFVAMQVVLTAALTACQADGDVSRSAVTKALPGVSFESRVLGSAVAFDERHELKDAVVHIYQVGPRGFELAD
jgi:branched-chain amino acid transport system substrate-binding protein